MPTTLERNKQREVILLETLIHRIVGERRLILASNRGPVEFHEEGGKLVARRGSGGLVSALSPLAAWPEVTWIASAMGRGDRQAAAESPTGRIEFPLPDQRAAIRFVVSPGRVYHKYYNVISNPLLWFLQHYMWDGFHTPNIDSRTYDAWEDGYVKVNRAFAKAIAEEVAGDLQPPLVLLQDYTLYLTAGFLRELLPEVTLLHFIHIPWPAPRVWQLLPAALRVPILGHLCANDIVGFQTQWDVRNFLHCCEGLLEGAEVDHRRQSVLFRGRLVQVNDYPVSVDVERLEELAASTEVQQYRHRLEALTGEATIVRVERLEPSKNIVRGMRAFELLLERHPEWIGRVRLLAFLVPSRTYVRQYRRYAEEVRKTIEAINDRFALEGWCPIEVFMENNYPQAIAGMQLYDVLLVNPVIDGMNLVAKEGPVVNTKDGVLVLSEAAGAHEQLRGFVLSVAPADVDGTAEALYQALVMPTEERASRSQGLKQLIAEEDAIRWLVRQFEDLAAVAEGLGKPA